jgi:hypothetical protein
MPRAVHVGFVVDKVSLKHVFLLVLQFSSVGIISLLLHIHLYKTLSLMCFCCCCCCVYGVGERKSHFFLALNICFVYCMQPNFKNK